MNNALQHILQPGKGTEIGMRLWWHSWDYSSTPLPPIGLLAGGAVTSMLLAEMWGGTYPVNDLDVFIPEVSLGKKVFTPVRVSGIALDQNAVKGDYSWHYPVGITGYQVLNSEREGLVNRIQVRMFGHGNTRQDSYRHVLAGFDLNCCQVGIDLETNQLVWTRAFEEFLTSGQLQVANVATPYHTAIRLAKKQSELGCHCDIGTEFTLLKSYVCLVSAFGWKNSVGNHYSRFFGKKYHELYQQHRAALDPHCQVSQGTDRPSLPGLTLYSMDLKVPSLHELLLPRYQMSGMQLNGISMVRLFDSTCRPTSGAATLRRLDIAIMSSKLAPICAVQNPGFLECDHHKKHFLIHEQFAGEHFGVVCLFNRIGLNIIEQLQAIRTISRAVKKHGMYVIGLLEDINNETLKNAGEFNEALIEQLVTEYRAFFSAQRLIQPVDLSGFPRRHQVMELVDSAQLHIEGDRQGHCVAGYAEAIYLGHCRIFRLEYLGVASTLQIVQNGKCGEHRTRFNKLPPAEHMTLAEELSAYIRSIRSTTCENLDEISQRFFDSMQLNQDDYRNSTVVISGFFHESIRQHDSSMTSIRPSIKVAGIRVIRK